MTTLRSHFVTDRLRLGLDVDALIARATRVARDGVDVIQVRERDLADRDLAALVRRMVAAVAATPTRVLVNDRFDIAVAAGAHGVHLRAASPPAARVRAIVPDGFIIGRSVHTSEEVDAAVADGASDYLLFGTVFASSGKPAGHPVAGCDGLREACRRSTLPVIAIGGIDASRLDDIANSGAAGFAGVAMFG